MKRFTQLGAVLVLALIAAGGLLYWSASAGAPESAVDRPALSAAGKERAGGGATFTTRTISILTYPYERCLNEQWNGPYMYRELDWGCYWWDYGTPRPEPQSYTLLVMENPYLRVTMLPELGGRVYQIVDRTTGHNLLYRNAVLKPTPFGPPEQDWWLAVGGIEWCLPVEEHGYEWGEPWDWEVQTSAAGVTVTVRDTAATNRLQAAIDVFLPSDSGALAIRPQLINPTASPLSYKFWLNAMLAPGPGNETTAGLQFIFNAEQMTVHSSGDDRLPGPSEPTEPNYQFDWPVHNGVDFSTLGNWREWIGFFEYPQAAADFMGLYNHDAGEGIARVFPSDLARGAKGFAFGWSKPLDWALWTDNGSSYVELHGGVAPTFWNQAQLPPGETLAWTEYWIPVHDIGTLSNATEEAVLGLIQEGDSLHIGIHTTRPRGNREATLYVWDRANCAELERRALPAFDPAQPLHISVPTDGRSPEQIAVVMLDDEGQLLAAVNPTDCLPPRAWVEPLPGWVPTSTFPVTWSGDDVWQGVAEFDVQVRDGYEGTWTGWLTRTPALSASFSGTHGHTYFFRARGRDVAGNAGTFESEEWGQAFTTVLTDPAPVLVTSQKWAGPQPFGPGQAVLCRVLISNTGNLTAHATLTDTPPAQMTVLTETLETSSGPDPSQEGEAIRWQGEVPPQQEVWVSYVLSGTGETPLLTPMTNTAEITGSVLGPFVRQETMIQAYVMRLVLVTRDW